MTSPVNTTVKHYRSDMPGAPVLNGQAGSKISQLDACLVTGYGLKSATSLVVSAGIASLTFGGGASAAWPGSVILVAGASNSALNGEQKVLTADGISVTFATAQPDGTDAGAVTFKIAPAGWEKVHSKTNVAAYRSLSPESTKMFLRVDDTSGQTVRVIGYETMSDIDTGAGPFPTNTMSSGGGYWAKSDAASATAVAWILASDGLFFIDSVAAGSHRGAAFQNCYMRGFGDFIPKNPAGDAYLCGLNASYDSYSTSMYEGVLDGGDIPRTAMARGYTGLGSAVQCTRKPYTGQANSYSGTDSWLGTFPSPVDGSFLMSRQYVGETAAPRGEIPGVLYCPQYGAWSTFKMLDTIAQGLRKYIVSSISSNGTGCQQSSNVAYTGVSVIDTTGPWR